MIHSPLAALATLALVGCAPTAKDTAISLDEPDSWRVYLIGNWSCARDVKPLTREDLFNLNFELGRSLEITTNVSNTHANEIAGAVSILTNTSYDLLANRITFSAESHEVLYTDVFSGSDDNLVWTPTAEDLEFQKSTRYAFDVDALSYSSMSLRGPVIVSLDQSKLAAQEIIKCRKRVKL